MATSDIILLISNQFILHSAISWSPLNVVCAQRSFIPKPCKASEATTRKHLDEMFINFLCALSLLQNNDN